MPQAGAPHEPTSGHGGGGEQEKAVGFFQAIRIPVRHGAVLLESVMRRWQARARRVMIQSAARRGRVDEEGVAGAGWTAGRAE